jgi:hypothetical protein
MKTAKLPIAISIASVALALSVSSGRAHWSAVGATAVADEQSRDLVQGAVLGLPVIVDADRTAARLPIATSFASIAFAPPWSSDAFARECWSAVGATAVTDEQSRDFVVRGAIPGPPVVVADAPRSLGPAVAVGSQFGFQDHMVSLKASAPAGTYVLRYSAVPTSYFDAAQNNMMDAVVYVEDNTRDRIVIQLKEIRYRTTAVPIDPQPEVRTVALIDTAHDPWHFRGDVPSGQFLTLHSNLFTLTAHRRIPIPESPPFLGREFVQYYVEVMLITNREPPIVPDVAIPTGQVRGPALALITVCPSMDMTTCLFREPNFGSLPFCLRGNESIPSLDASWRQQVSSLRVARGGLLLACEEPNFRGWCDLYAGSVPELKGDRNNAISSVMRIR